MIAKLSKAFRQVFELKQAFVAQKLNITREHLSRIETGKEEPSAEVIEQFGRLFASYLVRLGDQASSKRSVVIRSLHEMISALPDEDRARLLSGLHQSAPPTFDRQAVHP